MAEGKESLKGAGSMGRKVQAPVPDQLWYAAPSTPI